MTGEPPTIVLHLPRPPSTNKLWTSEPGKARRRSPAYRAWLAEAGWEARRQLVGTPMLTATFDAQLIVPLHSTRDRNNWDKPVLDLLEAVGCIRNDSGLRDYAVTADERDGICIALWDRGGAEQRPPRQPFRSPYFRLRTRVRATPAQVARYRRAGVLV